LKIRRERIKLWIGLNDSQNKKKSFLMKFGEPSSAKLLFQRIESSEMQDMKDEKSLIVRML